MSEAFLRDVLSRTWRGNARELRSYLEESVVMSEAGILDAPAIAPQELEAAAPSEQVGRFVPLHAALEETERLHIRRALGRTNGSVTRTAELLGISRKTLWEKMKRLSIANGLTESSR
jgi:DNA-binding NtrC family response regulator